MSRQHGYSLLELMVALAIIGVVTATVIPITDTQLKASRLKSDADAVRNLVGLAKMRASSRFTRARVRVDLGAQLLCPAGLGQDRRCVGERRCSDTHVHRGGLRVWHAGDSAAEHPGRYRALATLHHGSDGGRGDRQHILHQLQLARTAGRCRRVALSTARVLPAQRDWGFRDHGHVDTAHQVLVVAKWHCDLETTVRAT